MKKKAKNPLALQNEKLRLQVEELEAKLAALPEELTLLRADYKGLQAKLRKQAGIEQFVTNAVKESLADRPLRLAVPMVPKFPTQYADDDEIVALVHLTDWQVGKRTPTYDTDIARARQVELARKVTKTCHHYNKGRRIKELVVFWGGDMVEGDGNIFPAQAHTVDSSVMDQATRNVPEIMVNQLLYWLQSFEKIRVFAVRGNHGRPGMKHSAGHPATNWDTVSYRCAEMLLRDAMRKNKIAEDRVSIEIAEDFYVIANVLGHRLMLIHGDVGIKGHAGIPFYGISRRMAGWIDSIPQLQAGMPAWDHLYLGHFHQYASGDINGRSWFMGATPESANNFALSEMAAAGRPQQRLQLWSKKQCVSDLPIYLNSGFRIGGHVGPSKVTLG